MKLDTLQRKLVAVGAAVAAIGIISAGSVQLFVYIHSDFYEFMTQYEADWKPELEKRRALRWCTNHPGACDGS